MPATVLTTKLHVPGIRREFVPRPRLLAQLDEGTQHKLTLISAPAGFGKSTLVAEWLAQGFSHAAWVSPGESDNETSQFWTYIIAAFQRINPDIGIDAAEILNAAQLRPTQPVLIGLLNDLAQVVNDHIQFARTYGVRISRGQRYWG